MSKVSLIIKRGHYRRAKHYLEGYCVQDYRAESLKGDSARTMTKLYNDLSALRASRDSTHPVYALLVAHDKLDAAVAAAYGWEWPLSNEAILERLLVENLKRGASAVELASLPEVGGSSATG